MAHRKRFKDTGRSDLRIKPSEAEIMELLEKAAQQYEECIKLADLSDYPETSEVRQPRYSWDNPIGLVVTERSHANLV